LSRDVYLTTVVSYLYGHNISAVQTDIDRNEEEARRVQQRIFEKSASAQLTLETLTTAAETHAAKAAALRAQVGSNSLASVNYYTLF
jgi:pyruvate/2-oxoglutarate dehydrogenase complex dihydrolipoamide acyltransferase (E2) component